MTTSPAEEMTCLLDSLRRLAAGPWSCRHAAPSEVLDPLRMLVRLCDVNERLVGMVAEAQSPNWRPSGVTPQVARLVEGAAAALAVNGVWLEEKKESASF